MKILHRFTLLLLALWLSACASTSNSFIQGGADYFPGGSPTYDFGQGQTFENFANVARAQASYRLFSKERWWQDIKPAKDRDGNIGFLRGYYYLDVRWKLKDGREFMLERIDLRAIMREYFKTHQILLQHQRENRDKAIGDSPPILLYEIKDDTVVIKWQITINTTPLSERTAPATKEIKYKHTREQYVVTAIQGQPISGIDFEKWVEFFK